jgi:L-lactate dehydrogenase
MLSLHAGSGSRLLSRALRAGLRGSLSAYVSSREHHIGIVGAGAVGASCASSIIHTSSAAGRVSLFDINGAVAEGEVMDLEDEGYFTGTAVLHATQLAQLRDCDIVVITAGAKQKPDESRQVAC